MKRLFLLSLLTIIFPVLSSGQALKGKITNTGGEAIQYATVYIQELKQGTTSNTKGDYELKMPPGKYLVIFQSLGYEPVFVDINLTDKTITRDIILPEQYYEIPEVMISPSGEDAAYSIMRKAIGLAPYHLNQVNYYKADVYLKGNLVVNKIPAIVKKAVRMERKQGSTTIIAGGKNEDDSRNLKEGETYFMETYNEIEFTAPDKYVQKVISFNSTIPDNDQNISPMDFIQASFYQPVLADMAISPLSPQAFSHYNFKYLGASPQGNFTINKIQVDPKRKSQQLFEGIIYIVEDLWCIHSLDLTNNNLIGTIRIKELSIPVQDEIWMPVSYNFDIKVEILGFKSDIGYSSSIKYLDIKPDLNLRNPRDIQTGFSSVSETPDTVTTKTRQKIEKILTREEMSNRDMVALARLMKKEGEQNKNDSTVKNLETESKTTYIIGEDAAKKDSSYWAEIRPVPLSYAEKRSLTVTDSIRMARQGLIVSETDTAGPATGRPKSRILKSAGNFLFGHTWSDTSGFSFNFGGITDLKKISFNTVDGFVYGMDLRISKSWKNGNNFSLYPDIRYAFGRDKLMWKANINFSTGGLRQKQIYLRTGITSKDFSSGGSVDPFINTLTTLLMRRNYMKLYETRYLTAGYRANVANGLTVELSAGYDDRRILDNNTDFSILRPDREFTDNIPDNPYLTPSSYPIYLPDRQKHFDIETNITFIPFQRYRVYNSNRIPGESDWPTFNLIWKHGVNEDPGNAGEYLHFDMLKFEVSDKRDAGAFSEYRWRVRAGGFLNKSALSYIDFFHFNAQPLWLMTADYEDAIMLPQFYSLSTPDLFAEMHFKYTTPYLLLKLLPVMSNTLMRENLSFLYLGSRFHGNYTEIGYSLSEIFLFAEAGVYLGFNDFKYKSTGIKLIVRFN